MNASAGAHRWNVADFGAVGDGKTLNTQPIQRALDEAGKEGGGTVLVPPGTFLTGTVFLRSGVTLDLHPAARVLGSPDLKDYASKAWGQHIDRTPWHLLVAAGVHDITIRGGGTIDGNGPAFWEPVVAGPEARPEAAIPPGAFGGLDAIAAVTARQPDPKLAAISWIRARKEARPSPMIEITGCRDVRIQDVHVTNSAGWVLHLHNSDLVWVRGVKLTANLMGPNNDGFDITGCRDVMISDCYLSCCDDAICLKTTPDSRSCERVAVTNCVIRTKCVALKFGSESFHDFRQVTFSNCVVFGSSRAVGIYTKEGGTVEDVAITNIVCDTKNPFMVNRPIHMDCRRGKDGSKLGRIRNVAISNLVLRTDGRILLTGQPDAPLENIVLRDLQVVYPTVDDPAIAAQRVTCGQFANANPDARVARGVVCAENINNLVLDNLMVTWPELDQAGAIRCPPDWFFPVKAVNGSFTDVFQRPEFNTGRVPDFHVVWGRRLRGGYIHAPLARPAREGLAPYALTDSTISVR